MCFCVVLFSVVIRYDAVFVTIGVWCVVVVDGIGGYVGANKYELSVYV